MFYKREGFKAKQIAPQVYGSKRRRPVISESEGRNTLRCRQARPFYFWGSQALEEEVCICLPKGKKKPISGVKPQDARATMEVH